MPSNKQYIEQAIALAAGLGTDIDTEGLSNEQLGDLVSDLKAKTRDAELDTQADKEPEPEEAPEEKPPYSVASGKSIITRRGILADGDEIKAEDLAGGKEVLDAFVKSGHVVKA